MIATLALAAALIAQVFVLARLVLGPTALDRALAGQALGILTAVCVAALAAQAGEARFLDVALIALAAQLALAAANLKAQRRRSLQPPLAALAPSPAASAQQSGADSP